MTLGPTDLDLAKRLADVADTITLAAFRRSDLLVDTKPDLTPVTEADRGVEDAARRILETERPDDAIVGEEFGGGATSGRRWIIDPIDGTKNFVRGVPVWATLIALADDAGVCTSVVSAPALGRRWWASRGEGSWTQGPEDAQPRANRVSAVRDLADASFSFSDGIGWPSGSLDRITSSVWRSRAYGDFWSHLLVAEGVVDVGAEPELNVWDVAALVPIIEEAGGQITAFDGGDILAGPGGLTSNRLLHADALRTISG